MAEYISAYWKLDETHYNDIKKPVESLNTQLKMHVTFMTEPWQSLTKRLLSQQHLLQCKW